ncbi:MAG TPA: 2-amino-4-hydroxy-6-hydroxymethyldihydropteridine diphosphokinase [Oscillatoriaceae cyanobacterium M33_DOE_052]|uniref:2-amino-4-hydroxy-6-hydroxymethyldihydropteridine diphosphokinase n=1 Tax=Planktothricoides sp. SpSt-374 TaxID=2282167 RepID=A0A7C3ZX57_9CYAN|nr:2-amino-4-hydroxy-6-hydroxymethyldihydropteridine diphosphokinase [Oscillatoriaceae cyanobacterium M33_DOE_052]
MPSIAAIALGSNLGDSRWILENALETLAKTEGITLYRHSSWYRTTPIGPPQPDYLNGCALMRVNIGPEQLLQTLLNIEQQYGRTRTQHWGPRTLDLDLLLYDNAIVHTPTLELPHPRMRDRAFVLVPLAEIAPEWIEPVCGLTIAALLQGLDCSGVEKYHI